MRTFLSHKLFIEILITLYNLKYISFSLMFITNSISRFDLLYELMSKANVAAYKQNCDGGVIQGQITCFTLEKRKCYDRVSKAKNDGNLLYTSD